MGGMPRRAPYYQAREITHEPPDAAVKDMAVCAWAVALFLLIYAVSGYVPLPL